MKTFFGIIFGISVFLSILLIIGSVLTWAVNIWFDYMQYPQITLWHGVSLVVILVILKGLFSNFKSAE